MTIIDIRPKTILSSSGSETVEVTATTADGREITVSVPAGISAGKYEVANVSALEAVSQIEKIKPKLISVDLSQEAVDEMLAGSGLGGNATLAISVAWWKAGLPENRNYSKFPKLFTLMFEGGKHGNPEITIQEFTLIEDTVEQAGEDFMRLKDYLDNAGTETTVGAEGAFSPKGFDNWKALDTLKQVFPDKEIALDVAGSFAEEGVDYNQLLQKYNIKSIEDPYSDEEWDKWLDFYNGFGDKVQIVGDDLTVTNSERLAKALDPKVVNAMIVKPNQNGTISGTLKAIKMARDHGLKLVVSHRAQETNDDWIVDFTLEVEAEFVKYGGMDRGERIAKYNRLRELGMK